MSNKLAEKINQFTCEEHDHHDHVHHHEHDNNEHNHHDHHQHKAEEFPLLEISIHDQAVIGTLKFEITGNYKDAVRRLEEVMEKTSEEIEAAGGLIGHVKAAVMEQNHSCIISIPEAGDVQVKDSSRRCVIAECAHIIFRLESERLERILRKNYGQWL